MSEKETIKDEPTASQEQELTENVKEQETNASPEADQSKEEKLQLEVEDLKDKYLRLYSEFENYRRRTSKERLDLIKTASEDLIKEILPILDDFERAFKASEKEDDAAKVREGHELVFHKLVKTLENKGVKVMENLIGNPFDADTQEAITQIPAPTEDMKGKVIDVVEKGYTLGEKVIRFAKVVTGS
ncbi:nucleotide exchange factor GrpE [Cecembia calidifontis]|jgi:molecular chaperone GrpE|uniref:Protein GrpE n=1 Tax=Cecembia calidifontis TaxID=1187080 RepID=A0A4Q7P5P5_9BACT|nr:nucleotide exchange factor GrpE [Cecembia calidifontis]RZS94788.1 molecular chaperone GrpE [Cecembia calidifontis]